MSNPRYDLAAVDRTSPEQVAWAYLTERLSYSYRDTTAGAGVARAAQYLTPEAATLSPPPDQDYRTQDDQWAQAVADRTVAATTITQLITFRPDDPAAGTATLIVATWTRTLSNNQGKPMRHNGSNTLTLQMQTDNTWFVDDPGFSDAG